MNIFLKAYFYIGIMCFFMLASGCAPRGGSTIMQPRMPVKTVETLYSADAEHHAVLRLHVPRTASLPLDQMAIADMAHQYLKLSGLKRVSGVSGDTMSPVVEVFILPASEYSISLSATLHMPKANGRDVFRLYPPRSVPIRNTGEGRGHALEADLGPELDRLLQDILHDFVNQEPFTQDETNEPSPV